MAIFNEKSSFFRGNSPFFLHFQYKKSKKDGVYIAILYVPSKLSTKFIILNTKFLVFNTQFLVFDTEFLVFDTEFTMFYSPEHGRWLLILRKSSSFFNGRIFSF